MTFSFHFNFNFSLFFDILRNSRNVLIYYNVFFLFVCKQFFLQNSFSNHQQHGFWWKVAARLYIEEGIFNFLVVFLIIRKYGNTYVMFFVVFDFDFFYNLVKKVMLETLNIHLYTYIILTFLKCLKYSGFFSYLYF